MANFILGLAALPLGLLTVGGLYIVWRFLEWGYATTIIWKPRFGKRVYAYKVVAVIHGGHNHADALVGSTIIERRNLGPKHDYLISYDGMSSATLRAERIPGGGKWVSSQQNVDWDSETVRIIDEPVEGQTSHG
jgi:hypothetical protein